MADLYPNQLPSASGLTLADVVIVQQAGTPTVVEQTTIQGMMTTQYTGTEKTVPVDADRFGLRDSVSGFLQYMTFANIKAAVYTAFGALLAAGTAKTTPVGADNLLIADSAASNATKKLSCTNLVTYLSGLCSAGWNAATATSVTTTATVTGNLGHSAGAGGAATQLTSITTPITLNTQCGKITTVSHSWNAGTAVEFQFINSVCGANDILELSWIGGDILSGSGSALVTTNINSATSARFICIYPLFTSSSPMSASLMFSVKKAVVA